MKCALASATKKSCDSWWCHKTFCHLHLLSFCILVCFLMLGWGKEPIAPSLCTTTKLFSAAKELNWSIHMIPFGKEAPAGAWPQWGREEGGQGRTHPSQLLLYAQLQDGLSVSSHRKEPSLVIQPAVKSQHIYTPKPGLKPAAVGTTFSLNFSLLFKPSSLASTVASVFLARFLQFSQLHNRQKFKCSMLTFLPTSAW